MERFLDLISHKIHLLWPALWALSQIQMTDFPTLSYTSTSKIPTLAYLKPEKGTPFGRSLYMEYPPGLHIITLLSYLLTSAMLVRAFRAHLLVLILKKSNSDR